MILPKTWELLAAFQTCMASITVAAGYHSDAGLYVTREPSQIPETQPALIAIALESIERPEDPAMREIGRLVRVLVVGKVPTGFDDAQLRLHELIDDIQRALYNRLDVFPPGTAYPRFVDAQVIPPAEGMKWIGAQVRYSTHIRMR